MQEPRKKEEQVAHIDRLKHNVSEPVNFRKGHHEVLNAENGATDQNDTIHRSVPVVVHTVFNFPESFVFLSFIRLIIRFTIIIVNNH